MIDSRHRLIIRTGISYPQCINHPPLKRARHIKHLLALTTIALVFILFINACSFIQDETDGSEPTDQSDADTGNMLSDSEIYRTSLAANLHYQNFILQIGEQLFFTTADQVLVSSKPDGQDQIRLTDHPVSQLTSDGHSIFYTDSKASGSLYKMDMDGSNDVRITHEQTKYTIPYADRLYAINLSDYVPFSIKKDGTDRQILHKAMATTQVLHNHHLFITFSSAEHGVWYFDLKTGRQGQLLAQVTASLNIDDNGWLYFTDPTHQDQLFAAHFPNLADLPNENNTETETLTNTSQTETNTDTATDEIGDSNTTESEMLTAVQISEFGFDQPFIVSQGYLYAPNPDAQYRLYRWKLAGDQPISQSDSAVIVDDAVATFALLGDFIYYKRPDSDRIYRVSLIGGRPQRIT